MTGGRGGLGDAAGVRPDAVLNPAIVGLVLYAAQLAITFGRNIPLNNALDAAGPAGPPARPPPAPPSRTAGCA